MNFQSANQSPALVEIELNLTKLLKIGLQNLVRIKKETPLT